jgi:hypothetical protein
MRNRLPFLLILPAMILAPACMAQARDGALHQDEQAAGPAHGETPHRSAFGRVMAVMIDALKQDALQQEAPGDAEADAGAAPEVRTTAIGTPLGIEVGDAFRLDARTRAEASMPVAVQAGQ